MRRDIRVHYHTDPPATGEEIRAAAVSSSLLALLVTEAPPESQAANLARARARAAARSGVGKKARGGVR